MNLNIIKLIVQNYEYAKIEDIEQVLIFIANNKKQKLGIDFVFEVSNNDGGVVKDERTSDGKMQVEVGLSNLYDIAEAEYLGIDYDKNEKRKEFIEAILATFHELRHVEQNNNMIDNPVYNNESVYKMTREKVIREIFPGFINLYNYENADTEIDAMMDSLIETVNFLKQMGSDITADEVFQVMKEKELKHLNYNLDYFGDTYESALKYFTYIYNNKTSIVGYPEILTYLSDEDKILFQSTCMDLHFAYLQETDVDNQLEILKEMALRLSPELYDKYPLLQQNQKKR